MTMVQNRIAAPRTWRWTKAQYHQMGELGWFEDHRVELLDGEIIEMPPMGSWHATIVTVAGDRLREAFTGTFFVRIQMPLDFGEAFEPEPDVAVIQGKPTDFLASHPTTAALIVEVAETSYELDRGRKASLYAREGIPDYWILNLARRRLEVLRNPVPQTDALYGYEYAEILLLEAGASVAPLHAPNAPVAVADLLP